jgi:hypothetical protein
VPLRNNQLQYEHPEVPRFKLMFLLRLQDVIFQTNGIFTLWCVLWVFTSIRTSLIVKNNKMILLLSKQETVPLRAQNPWILICQGLALSTLHAARAGPRSTGDPYDLFTKETECVAAPELLYHSPQFIYSDTRSSVAISRYAHPLQTPL